MSTAGGQLVRAELRLMTRDPLVLTFVFAFPIVRLLIIGGPFGTMPDPAFEGLNPHAVVRGVLFYRGDRQRWDW
jgi:ABC-2 type transport system permease protein